MSDLNLSASPLIPENDEQRALRQGVAKLVAVWHGRLLPEAVASRWTVTNSGKSWDNRVISAYIFRKSGVAVGWSC